MFFVESSVTSHICPNCQGVLAYRDSRIRIRYCMWQHINYDILLSAITLFKDSYIISLVILSPIILVSFPDKLAKA
ncbi:MAG: hypothetical protein ACI4E4_10340, partial [Acetatifactor sp.]